MICDVEENGSILFLSMEFNKVMENSTFLVKIVAFFTSFFIFSLFVYYLACIPPNLFVESVPNLFVESVLVGEIEG